MFNYHNIGGKLKGLAKATFIVEAILSLIAGIAMMAEDEDLIATGFFTIIVGVLVAYVASWLLYAFGELVEDVSLLRGKVVGEKNVTYVQQAPYANTYAAPAQPAAPAAGSTYCPFCGAAVNGEFCTTCGAKVK